MKFNEFQADAIRQHYRRKGLPEEQIDEIIPAIAAVGRVAGTAAARGGAALAKGAAKGVGALAKGAAKAGAKAATGAAKAAAKGVAKSIAGGGATDAEQEPSNTISKSTTGTQSTRPTQSVGNKQNVTKMIRPGQTIKMPAGNTGKPTDFKVSGQQGKDVRIQNPRPMPGEPKEFVFNKDDLEQALKNMQ